MTEHRWTDNHGPDKLYDKFEVRRRLTGEVLGEDGEFVFVLRPERDSAAWVAMKTYADAVRHRAPHLSDQMQEKIEEIAHREMPGT